MNIVFFAHPTFLNHQSMPRFANMLATGMIKKGHQVTVWMPEKFFLNLKAPRAMQKWLGYLDQYLVFPNKVRKLIKANPPDTIYVFCDQALGPWVPLVTDKPHVIHCHDFLAQRSALGEFAENKTSKTGRIYQDYIRSGYSKGKNFISVSKKTQADLHQFLIDPALLSEVVYNGLNQSFQPQDVAMCRRELSQKVNIELQRGYLLHVGGNTWYKNRKGVIRLYDKYRANNGLQLPLLMIGEAPDADLLQLHKQSQFATDIHFISGMDDKYVRMAYSGASVFIFPSLEEGFGWPIAEAMASGTPVITTNAQPMTEVAGDAGFLINRMPYNGIEIEKWAEDGAAVLSKILNMGEAERAETIRLGIINANRFNADDALDKIEAIYKKIAGAR